MLHDNNIDENNEESHSIDSSTDKTYDISDDGNNVNDNNVINESNVNNFDQCNNNNIKISNNDINKALNILKSYKNFKQYIYKTYSLNFIESKIKNDIKQPYDEAVHQIELLNQRLDNRNQVIKSFDRFLDSNVSKKLDSKLSSKIDIHEIRNNYVEELINKYDLIDKYKLDNNELANKINQLTKQVNYLSIKLKDKINHINTIDYQLNDKIKRLDNKNKQINQLIIQKDITIKNNEQDFKLLTNKIDTYMNNEINYINQIETLNNRINELDNDFKSLSHDNKVLTDNNKQYEHDIMQLNQNLNILTQEKTDLSNRYDQLVEELDKLVYDMSLNQSSNQANDNNNNNNIANSDTTNDIKKKKKKVDLINSSSKALNNHMSTFKDLKIVQDQLSQEKTNNIQLVDQNKLLTNNIDKSYSEINILNDRLNQLNKQIVDCKLDYDKQLKDHQTVIRSLQQQNEELQLQLDDLNKINSKIDEQPDDEDLEIDYNLTLENANGIENDNTNSNEYDTAESVNVMDLPDYQSINETSIDQIDAYDYHAFHIDKQVKIEHIANTMTSLQSIREKYALSNCTNDSNTVETIVRTIRYLEDSKKVFDRLSEDLSNNYLYEESNDKMYINIIETICSNIINKLNIVNSAQADDTTNDYSLHTPTSSCSDLNSRNINHKQNDNKANTDNLKIEIISSPFSGTRGVLTRKFFQNNNNNFNKDNNTDSSKIENNQLNDKIDSEITKESASQVNKELIFNLDKLIKSDDMVVNDFLSRSSSMITDDYDDPVTQINFNINIQRDVKNYTIDNKINNKVTSNKKEKEKTILYSYDMISRVYDESIPSKPMKPYSTILNKSPRKVIYKYNNNINVHVNDNVDNKSYSLIDLQINKLLDELINKNIVNKKNRFSNNKSPDQMVKQLDKKIDNHLSNQAQIKKIDNINDNKLEELNCVNTMPFYVTGSHTQPNKIRERVTGSLLY